MASKTLKVNIVGDADKLKKALGEADREVSGFGKKMGTVVAAGAAAAGAAIGALAVKGVKDFAGFERSMNEVFTLLPGISGNAMKAMEGDVKNFAKEFGVLPNDVVPALYQSLSAGVPKDNVFEFLETAQKAAKGGVTDLETAVNGITGVVNAYGSEVITAGEASDLMFTAVRLGKTTFDEMSASLGDVTPIAGALGVSFEEVSAALAASTSITGNTAKSVTGLKNLMSELGKEGQVAAKNFEEAAGTSFPAFIEGGGSLAEALEIMKGSAEESGGSIMDLFGSIEAGQAALQLTGSETFVNNLAEMEASAGATDAAFQTMDQGLAVVREKISAGLSVALLDLGDALAPIVEKLGQFALDVLPQVTAGLETTIGFVSSFSDEFSTAFTTVQGIVDKVRDVFAGVFGSGGDVSKNMDGTVSTLRSAFDNVREIVSGATDAVRAIIDTFTKVAQNIWDRFGEHILKFIERTWNNVQQVFEGVTRAISGVLDVFVGLFTGDWERFWGGIQKIFSGVWSAIHGILRQAVNVVSTIIGGAMAAISAVWSLAWNALKTFVGSALGGIVRTVGEKIGEVLQWFSELPGRITSAVGDLGSVLVSAGADVIRGLWDGIKGMGGWLAEKVSGFISDNVPGPVKKVLGIRSPSRVFMALGKDTIRGFIEGVDGQESPLRSAVSTIFSKLSGDVSTLMGSFGAIGGKEAAQAAMAAAERELADAQARQKSLGGLIGQARRDLSRVKREASGITTEERLKELDAEDRLLQAQERLTEAQESGEATAAELERATLNVKVAEQELASVRAENIGANEAVREAEQALKDLLDEQKEASDRVTEAQEALTQAQLRAIEAEKALEEQGRKLLELGPESEAMFLALAEKAGVNAGAVSGLVAQYRELAEAMRAAERATLNNAAGVAGAAGLTMSDQDYLREKTRLGIKVGRVLDPGDKAKIDAALRAEQLRVPHLADGGIVKARPGGTLALIAEAGQDEAVIPLPRGAKAPTGTTVKVESGAVQVIVQGDLDRVSLAEVRDELVSVFSGLGAAARAGVGSRS